MSEAMLLPLATWQSFYILIGTAAATLTGLMFVVATLIAGVRVSRSTPSDAFTTFSTPTVFHFGIALLVRSLISFASMVMASRVGELAALRLHATELLLLLGAAVVLVIERPARRPLEATEPLGREQAELLHNR